MRRASYLPGLARPDAGEGSPSPPGTPPANGPHSPVGAVPRTLTFDRSLERKVFHVEQAVTVATLALLASQITSIIRFITGGEGRRALTAVIPWLAAFAALGLGAHADATSTLTLPGFDVQLGDMDIGSLVLAAMTLGATGGFAHKVVTAIDGSDSAVEPPLGAAVSDRV